MKLNCQILKLNYQATLINMFSFCKPDDFMLNKNKTAAKTFSNFSPSHRFEYLEWITEAKTEETRNKRIASTIEWLTEGKPRYWKYVKK